MMDEAQTMTPPLFHIAAALSLSCAAMAPSHAQHPGKVPAPQPETTTTSSPADPSDEAKKSCGMVGTTYLCIP